MEYLSGYVVGCGTEEWVRQTLYAPRV